MANKYASVLQSGTNNYLTSAEHLNGIATDVLIRGVIGSVGSTSGVAPAVGSFAVNAQGSPNMTVAVSSGQAYVRATPTGGSAQSVRVTSDATENVTIAANSTGGTRYDFVYIKVDADKMNNPAVTGLDAVTFVTQRSTTQEVDSNGALANALLIAVVTVSNGASSISNSNIYDTRIPLSGGWNAANETWSYSSADSPTFVVTVPSDATTKYSVGMRVGLWQAGWKYFIITAVSSTTLTLYGGTDYTLTSAGISNPMFSGHKAPLGFPVLPSKWTVTASDTSDRSQGVAVANTWYNLGSLSISMPIGAWYASYSLTQYSGTTSGGVAVRVTLSTANNTESNTEMTSYWETVGGVSQQLSQWIQKAPELITVAAKTTHYLNSNHNSTSALHNLNARRTARIKLVCAYL
jgi:hypothetical protein